jgi:phospholipid/cholesterol/gamma-HCH transport system permease protein
MSAPPPAEPPRAATAGAPPGRVRQAIAAAPEALTSPSVPPRLWIANAGGMASLGIGVLGQLLSPGLSWRTEFTRQFTFALSVTLGPAAIVAFVIGFSGIGIQAGSLASAFGAVDRISGVAPVAFLRSLGPALTTAIVAGTLGATITSELGARKIREELMALEVLGVNPVRNLVLPRVVSLALAMPIINLITFWAGVAGVFTAVTLLYGGTPAAFFENLLILTNWIDLWSNVVQATLFGTIIAIIAAYKGMAVSGGTEGVGRAVNESVVTCLVTVFTIAVVYTMLFQALYPEVNFVV